MAAQAPRPSAAACTAYKRPLTTDSGWCTAPISALSVCHLKLKQIDVRAAHVDRKGPTAATTGVIMPVAVGCAAQAGVPATNATSDMHADVFRIRAISKRQQLRADLRSTPLLPAAQAFRRLAAYVTASMHKVSAHLKPPTTGRVLEVSAAMAILLCNCRTRLGWSKGTDWAVTRTIRRSECRRASDHRAPSSRCQTACRGGEHSYVQRCESPQCPPGGKCCGMHVRAPLRRPHDVSSPAWLAQICRCISRRGAERRHCTPTMAAAKQSC